MKHILSLLRCLATGGVGGVNVETASLENPV